MHTVVRYRLFGKVTIPEDTSMFSDWRNFSFLLTPLTAFVTLVFSFWAFTSNIFVNLLLVLFMNQQN